VNCLFCFDVVATTRTPSSNALTPEVFEKGGAIDVVSPGAFGARGSPLFGDNELGHLFGATAMLVPG